MVADLLLGLESSWGPLRLKVEVGFVGEEDGEEAMSIQHVNLSRHSSALVSLPRTVWPHISDITYT